MGLGKHLARLLDVVGFRRSGGDKKQEAGVGDALSRLMARSPRVELTSLHSAIFEIAPDGIRAQMANISITGVGILRKSVSLEMVSGQEISGTLVCGNSRARVSAEIVHVSESVIGCKFIGHSPEVRRLVQSYLNLELSALAMISVKQDMLQADPEGIPHWVHGKNNCEVFFVTDGDSVVRFNLTFFGNYIEGGRGRPSRYGQVIEDDSSGKPRHKASSLIRWDSNPDPEMRSYALRFVGCIPYLEDAHRAALLRLLNANG